MKFKLLLSAIALGASLLTGFSQTYSVGTVALPISTLAAGGNTNLANGWSAITSVTNTFTYFTNTAFVTVTNIVSSTNTQYSAAVAPFQKDLGLIITQTAGVGTNAITFARLLDATTIDTSSAGTFTISCGNTAAGTATTSTNLPSTWYGGFYGVQITAMTWTAASQGWTNGSIKYGVKKGVNSIY